MGTKPQKLSIENSPKHTVEIDGAEYSLIPRDEMSWGDARIAGRFGQALQDFMAAEDATEDDEIALNAKAHAALSRILDAPAEVLSKLSDGHVRRIVEFWAGLHKDPLDETTSETSQDSNASTEAVPKAG